MTSEIGHVMDIMATCVDLADAEYPTTYKGHDILPMEGKSLLPIFKTGHRKGHDYLGFEHSTNVLSFPMMAGNWFARKITLNGSCTI